jgi:hypothetical protein
MAKAPGSSSDANPKNKSNRQADLRESEEKRRQGLEEICEGI